MDLTALHDPGFGSAHAILGPMTSGKSDELVRRIDRFRRMRNAVVRVYKPRLVDEAASLFQGKVHSRTGAECAATVVGTAHEIVTDIISKREEIGKNKIVVVGIDEAQFILQLDQLLEFANDRKSWTWTWMPAVAEYLNSWTMIVFFLRSMARLNRSLGRRSARQSRIAAASRSCAPCASAASSERRHSRGARSCPSSWF